MQQSKQNMASLTNEAAASSSSSSLPPSSTDHQNHYTYEVFLSFRGEDTRFNFTDHLYNALCRKGIETFRDADKLRRGEDVSQELLKAIEESRVSIVVFSQNYASSRWCLNELVNILECRKSKRQEVRPVFYKVAPSDIRHQTGAFGDAFATLVRGYEDSMDKWKTALKEAADLSGWPLKDGEYENKFIEDIVEELSAQVINPSCYLDVAEHPIGLESCRQDVIRLLYAEENIVRMVGIWGPGGIGKTTIGKDVFNSIRHEFKSSCFLADVRSNSNGLAQLQERLLFDILRDENLKVHNVDVGVSLIKTRMRNKKVLLILDDVSHSSQLKNLVPSPDCFGPGSRILITTRDKRWLIARQVDEVYEVKMLNDRQALNLFSLNAFKRNEPPGDYLKLAQRAVRYAQGLPLALIILGSHLFRRSREEWEATLDSCGGEAPHREIRDVLKISFDALEVDLKGYFLDIACFFKGELVDHVKPILEACYDLKSVNSIAQLQEKALIRIDNGCTIWMHDLIEEMGKDIVHQESPDKPGERSRLWSEEDVNDVLANNTGTNKVIGIQVPWLSSTISLNAKSFSEMKNLRYISMGEGFSGDIDYLSNQLRWLDWQECPLQCLPSDFQANRLVNLDISWSHKITRLWEGRKNFSRLTCMNLSHCASLERLPDLSGIPNLKELELSDCRSLKELPDLSGIPNLKRLDLYGCESLKELPDLSGIPNLKELNLIDCKSLKELPDLSGILNLKKLDLRGCESLKKLPDLSGIPDLKELNLIHCTSLERLPNLSGIPNLKELNLSHCTSLERLSNLSGIPNLKELNIIGCKSLKELPDLSGILNLKKLDLRGCESLKKLPDLSGIPNLKELNLSHCTSLERLPDLSGIPNLKELNLYYCTSLVEVPDSVGLLDKLVTLNVGGCSNLIMFPRKIYWKSLETISIMCCKLEEFSEVGEEMDFLTKLKLIGTRIEELHPSITKLIGLKVLDLSVSQSLTTLPCNIYELHNLKTLYARECSKLTTFPKIPVKMDSLRQVSLSGSDIRELDESIENLIGLDVLNLRNCKNLTTLPCSIYGLQNLWFLDLSECSKLVRFPTNTKISNVDGCSLSLPKLRRLCMGGCSLLSDCDFLMTLDCWETLWYLDLSRNNFVSLPACLTKFVNLETLDLEDCKRLREIPELPPNVVHLSIRGCELLEKRLSTLTNRGAVIEAASPSIEERTPPSWLSLSSLAPKRRRTTEEPSPTPVNPPKRQRTAAGGQASTVHFAYELTISPIPMFPDLHSAHHSTTTPQLQHQAEEPTELLRLSLNSSEPTKPRGPVKGDQEQRLSLSVLPTLPSTSEL